MVLQLGMGKSHYMEFPAGRNGDFRGETEILEEKQRFQGRNGYFKRETEILHGK